MKKLLTSIFALVLAIGMYAQVAVDSEFDEMLNDLLSFSVPYVTVDELKALDGACLLDTRELEEYEVSHIPNAEYIGYNTFDESALENIPKEQTIVVYCSVGYRSEKIGERLKKMGYKNVYNLYGSIFEWVNEGNEVIDKDGTTTKVHTYNKQWSKWLEKGEKVY